jgi:hypothetical protein
VWTDSWLSIAGAGCGLTSVGAGEEHARKVAACEGPGGQQSQVWAAWWQEWQVEVVDGFLVEPRNQGRAGTTWEPSHEWRLVEVTPSVQGFQWFTGKPLGSLVDP